MKGPAISAREALALLKEGNARFVCSQTEGPNRAKEQRRLTASQGQRPFVTIISCSDSRVPLSVIFDRGIGDIFTVRVAGNVCGPSEIGSTEYAVEHLKTPLVVILGHTKCGAITAVANGDEVSGYLLDLAKRIIPAVEKARNEAHDLTGDELLTECAIQNVKCQMESLVRDSDAIRRFLKAGTVELIGALYDVEHGDVTWLGGHRQLRAMRES